MKSVSGASIILTEACNLDCTYCYEKRKSPEIMPMDTVVSAVNFVFENRDGAPKVSFIWFGGEPLLAEANLIAGVEYAISRAVHDGVGVDNLVITNGTLWNDEIEALFNRNPELRLQLSWDGLPEFQDANRGMSAILEANLNRMLKMGNQITAHVQITPVMAPKLLENISYIVTKMGNKARVVIRPITEMDGWDTDTLTCFGEQLLQTYEKFGDIIDKVANCEHMIESNGTCGAGKNFCSVAPSGDLYACHRFYFQANRDFKVGSLSAGFLSNSKTEILEEYTRDSILGCTECPSYEVCDRCIAANFGENYDILMPKDSACEVHKTAFFALFNFIRTHRPWLTNPDAPTIVLPAELTDNSAQTLMEVLRPYIGELMHKVYYLEEEQRRLRALLDHRTAGKQK